MFPSIKLLLFLISSFFNNVLEYYSHFFLNNFWNNNLGGTAPFSVFVKIELSCVLMFL